MKLALAFLFIFGLAQGNWLCSPCEELVQLIIKEANNNVDTAKQLVKQECTKYFGSGFEGSLCTDALDALVTEILSLISGGSTAQEVCSTIHLCSSSLPNFDYQSQVCDTCDALVQQAINYIDNGDIPPQIAQLCPVFGLGQDCSELKNLVNQLGSAAAICHQVLPFCPASSVSVVRTDVQAGSVCEYCEEAVGVLENLLKNNEQAIANDLKMLCNKLPGEEGQICSDLIDQYLPTLIQELLNLLSPATLCKDLHLCDSTGKQAQLKELLQVGVNWDPVECNFCKMAFQFIQQNFLSTSFQQALLQDLAKGCQQLGDAKAQQECMNILGTYGEMILTYVKSLIDPDHICPMIKMCPAPSA